MEATVNKPKEWKRVLNITVPREEVESAFDRKLKEYRGRLKLPGFRPGKAPKELIKGKYGEAIRAEMIEDIIQKSYEAACKDHELVPISSAKLNDLKAQEGDPITFTIEIEVEPEVEIKNYRKLKVKVNPSKIKAADVDKVIEDLRGRLATFEDVDRPSKKGDFLTLEYQRVLVDGQERSDVSSPQYPIEIGSSKIKEFDKGLIGKKAGETAELSIRFPKDYGDKEIAGKHGTFTIKVLKVQQRNLPEIDEEFFKKVGDAKDEAELRERITKDLEAREMERAKNEAYDRAIDTLIKDNPFEVPPSRVDQYIDHMHEQVKQYTQPGQPEPTREQVEERYRDTATRTLKRYRIVEYVASKENIKATQEEVDAQIKRLAERYGQPFDTVKQTLRQNGTTNRIRQDIREQKTLDFLIGEYQPEKS